MPQRYQYSTDTTTVECSNCHQTRSFPGRLNWMRDEEARNAVATDGTLVRDFIRWLPARSRYHSWCRECERRARQENARPVTPRTLNGERKFGVELELKFPAGVSSTTIRSALDAEGLADWKVKSDGSLSSGNGWEIVSPPLQGDDGFEQVRKATRALRALGAKPDRQCGLHVHHEVRDLGLAAIKRVCRSWARNQDMLDGLVSPSRRNNEGFYCQRLTEYDLSRIDALTQTRQLGTVLRQRYRTLNVRSYGKYGTLEIRQHQGTCDYEKIRSWVKLGQAIIDAAKANQEPLPETHTMREFITTLGHRLDETAATFCLGRAVQFGAVTV